MRPAAVPRQEPAREPVVAPAEPVPVAVPARLHAGPEGAAPGGVLTTDRVLDLQQRVGNAVVSRMMQERAGPADAPPNGAAPAGRASEPAAAPGGRASEPAAAPAAAAPAPASAPAGSPDGGPGAPSPPAGSAAAANGAGPAEVDDSDGPRVRVADPAAAGGRLEPDEDPRFRAMKAKAGQAAKGAKAHAPASAGAAAAQAASAPPAGDAASQAKAAQVEEMAQQQPGVFDRRAFIAAVRRAVDAASPSTLEEAEDFKSSGKAGRVKDEVAGLVKGGKKESEKDIKQATEAPPDATKATPKPVRPMPAEDPGRPPAGVGAGAAMPGPRPAAETDLAAGPAKVDAQMADAGVTETQLVKANEPDFTAAVAARREAKEHAATAPAQARGQEQEILTASRSDAEAGAADQLAGMHGAKVKAVAKALGAKTEAKGADEGKRAKVAAELQAIYDKTKTEVTAILGGLDGKVDAAFTSGEQAARMQFETYVEAEMAAYKERRYSGAAGALRWAKDLLFSLPDEVNVLYERGRAAYLKAMDGVIGQVADIVGAELAAARARIAAGRAEIRKYVAGLSPDLRDVGRDAERKLEGHFDELGAEVDSKQDELVDSLAQKYVAARDAVDARIDELKAANKGLVDRAADAIGGVVKTILKLKDMLLGVLKKGADVIGDIIADPIGFLGKLVDGVKAGLNKFVGKIGTHLKNAFMDWLFGALAGAGIKLPEKLDLAGILDLTMQVLGLTYQSIRARVVKLVGAPAVERMEQVVDVFKTLVTKGVGGLWEWIKDKLANLEEMVLGQIKEFLIEKVIKGGITWIISLLNPAAAFVKACKAIYDIVMWIVERGAQLMEFVNSVLDSIGAIAKGNISIVADRVEGALAKALPVAISFLASLLGLGGISQKIKSIIDTVRKPIDKAVDWVITGAVKGFKKMFGGAIGWAKGKYEKGKQWAKGKAEAGKQWAKGKLLGGDDSAEGKQARLDKALDAAVSAANRFKGKPVGERMLRPLLSGIRLRYGLTRLEPVIEADNWAIHGEINPAGKKKSEAKVAGAGGVPWDSPVVAELQALNLSKQAIERIFGAPRDVSNIKGQIHEEIMLLGLPAEPAVSPDEGDDKFPGTPETFPEHRVRDAAGDKGPDALTVIRGHDPALGRTVQILGTYQAKSGPKARLELTSETEQLKEASKSNRAEARRQAIDDLMEEAQPGAENLDGVTRSKLREQIERDKEAEIEARAKKYHGQTEPGQLRKDVERFGEDTDPRSDASIPAMLTIDGKTYTVVKSRPSQMRAVGVLPRGLSPGESTKTAGRQGLRLEVEHTTVGEPELRKLAHGVLSAMAPKAP